MERQNSSAGNGVAAAPARQTNNILSQILAAISQFWLRYGIFALTVLLAIVLTVFLVNKHNALNTRTYDFARFSQAIWNTLQGRVLFTTIDARSILGNHFSPYMALLAPLLWLWPNERLLFLVQAASVAVAGLILALMVRRRQPALAPWFMLAYALNPAIQQLALYEFRRIVLAMPFLALALFGLAEKRRWLMLGAALIALLAKEDVGLFVFGVGLFLLIFQRDWRWGLGMMLLGFGWSLIVSFWVIPLFRAPGTEYPQLYYFAYLGSSYTEIIGTLRQDPLIIPQQLFSLERLAALWRIFLPLGLFLPFLGADWLLIALPSLLLLLLSGDAEMFSLQKWYPATILPVFFAAIAAGLGRFEIARARWLTAWLLLSALLGYWLYSPLPGGGAYEPALYTVSDHDRLGLALAQEIPTAASVATQPHYAPHLSLRANIYHFPWIKIGAENIDYFLFDQGSSTYPFSEAEMTAEINTFLADPALELVAAADGLYLFRQDGRSQPNFASGATLEEALQLDGFDIAVPDAQGFLRLQDQQPLALQPGQPLRVDLYWQALAAPGAERTVSVRLLDPSGQLVAQHDGLPAGGSKPTSWWQPDQQIRDVHALTLPPGTPAGPLSLEVVIYDTYSLETIPWAAGQESLPLATLEVRP